VVTATDISSLKNLERGEIVLETGLTYDGLTPVTIRATKRERRYLFSDGGGAVAAADVDPTLLDIPDSIVMGCYSVNVSRHGVVSLPGFARSSDDWLARLPELVAQGSIALYEQLLELEISSTPGRASVGDRPGPRVWS
jgi:hypothetical protein